MVDRPRQGANTTIIVDYITFLAKPHKQKPAFYRDLYLKEELSASQIAHKIGSSKTAVLENLRRQGIRIPGGRRINPNNYTLHQPPYGFYKVDNRLIINKSEMRVCRLVVELCAKQELPLHAVANELIKQKIKNRKGQILWTHNSVSRIFKRWSGKI